MSQSQPVSPKPKDVDKGIACVSAPVPERGLSAVSKEDYGPSLKLESQELPSFEGRMSVDLMVILKERQQQNWAFDGS